MHETGPCMHTHYQTDYYTCTCTRHFLSDCTFSQCMMCFQMIAMLTVACAFILTLLNRNMHVSHPMIHLKGARSVGRRVEGLNRSAGAKHPRCKRRDGAHHPRLHVRHAPLGICLPVDSGTDHILYLYIYLKSIDCNNIL